MTAVALAAIFLAGCGQERTEEAIAPRSLPKGNVRIVDFIAKRQAIFKEGDGPLHDFIVLQLKNISGEQVFIRLVTNDTEYDGNLDPGLRQQRTDSGGVYFIGVDAHYVDDKEWMHEPESRFLPVDRNPDDQPELSQISVGSGVTRELIQEVDGFNAKVFRVFLLDPTGTRIDEKILSGIPSENR